MPKHLPKSPRARAKLKLFKQTSRTATQTPFSTLFKKRTAKRA